MSTENDNEEEYTVGNANVMDAFMLNIKIVTDKSNTPISFQRSNLVFPESDTKETISLNLTDTPFFSYKYVYPLQKLRSIYNYQDRLNIFFNRNQFIRYMSTNGELAVLADEEQVNDIMEKNLLTMIEILMPTKFPVKNNIHTSYKYLTGNSNNYKPLLFDLVYPYKYIHLNLNNEPKTLKKVVLLNDIVNHPRYNELIEKTINFQGWVSEDPKRREKFITEKVKGSSGENSNIFITFDTTFLNKYRTPNYRINNKKFQQLIEHKAKKQEDANKQVEEFHKFIKYVNEKYIQAKITQKTSKYESLIRGGICDVDMREVLNPTKEIYLYIELHDMKIDEKNVNDIKCDYADNYLGNELLKMINGIPLQNNIIVNNSNTGRGNIGTGNSSRIGNDPKGKSSVILQEYEMQNINTYILDYARSKKRKFKPNDNKTDKIVALLKNVSSKLRGVTMNNYQQKYLINETDLDSIVKFIVNNKLKPKEAKNDFSQDFARIFKAWVKEKTNFNPNKLNTELKINLNSLIGNIKSEIKNEKSSKQFQNKQPTTDKFEIEKKSDYHISVYEFYLYIAEDILDESLNEIYNLKPQDEVDDAKPKKGGNTKKQKHKKRNGTSKRNKK